MAKFFIVKFIVGEYSGQKNYVRARWLNFYCQIHSHGVFRAKHYPRAVLRNAVHVTGRYFLFPFCFSVLLLCSVFLSFSNYPGAKGNLTP